MRTFLILLTMITLGLAASLARAENHPNANSVFVDLGYSAGGVNFGAAYDYLYNGAESVGGQLHLYQKDSGKGVDGYMIVGGFTGFHFFKGDWDLSLAPGLNIMSISSAASGRKDETILGPSLSLSLVTTITPRVAIGFDYVNYYGWFSDNYRGLRVSDLDFKAKLNF